MRSFWRTIACIGFALSIGPSVAVEPLRPLPRVSASPRVLFSATQGTLALAAPLPAATTVTAYTLAPDLARKAHRLGQIAFWGQLGTFVYSVIALLFLLKWTVVPTIRDWAERATSMRILQAAIVAPLFFLAFDVLSLPPGLFRQWVIRT